MNEKRSFFDGRLSAVLVAAGSSVGLGNIWRFPYVAGSNGGGAFVLVYLGCLLLLGMPVMMAEFAIGRHTRQNAVGAYRSLDKRWSWLGYNGVVSALLIMGFYFVVAGWVGAWLVRSASGELAALSDSAACAKSFASFTSSPWAPLAYTLGFILLNHAVIVLGVKKGIERSARFLMPLLLVMLVVLAIRSLLMEGAAEGIEFFLKPDFSKITPRTVLVAMGQVFFSLSVGLGTMVTYASYFNRETDLKRTALHVSLIDTGVAILAGIVIFPAVFSAGIAPEAGPSLVFITLPDIFNSMGHPALWSSIFFLLLAVAALTSTISLHETATLYLHEEWHLSRSTAAWITTMCSVLLASLASLSMGTLKGWQIGGLNFFDQLDFLTANILLPLGGLATCIFAGWVLDRKVLVEQMHSGKPRTAFLSCTLVVLLRWICPVLLVMIFLDNLHLI